MSDVVKLTVNRASVAAGDDVDSHREFWTFPESGTVDDLLVALATGYLPAVAGFAGWIVYQEREGRRSDRVLGLIYSRDHRNEERYICRSQQYYPTLGELAECSELSVYAGYLSGLAARPVWVSEVKSGSDYTGAQPHKLESEAEADARRDWRLEQQLRRIAVSAATKRRAWIHDRLLSAGAIPAGSDAFIANSFRHLPELLCPASIKLTEEQFGFGDSIDGADAHQNDRAHVMTLAMVLGAYEWRMVEGNWRLDPQGRNKEYFEFLGAQGYLLTPIERVVAGQQTIDEFITTEGIPDQTDT
jgi:hypothetical protein